MKNPGLRRIEKSKCAVIMMICVALTACNMRSGLKATSYGNLHFLGSGTCDTLTLGAGESPEKIEIVLADGRQLYPAGITKDFASTSFGSPGLSVDHPRKGKIEKFNVDDCVITFANGKFSRLQVRGAVKIINLANSKSVTLPASEADIRKVFGKPTEIEYLHSQQP